MEDEKYENEKLISFSVPHFTSEKKRKKNNGEKSK